MDGNEFKTEHYEDLDDLVRSIHGFIDDTVKDDDEFVYRNEENDEN
jgi:hypothetical protein